VKPCMSRLIIRR